MRETPAALGYFMPAEWHRHTATWLAFPHNEETWGDLLSDVEDTYVQMIFHLHHGEIVNLLVNDEAMEEGVKKKLLAADVDLCRVIMHRIPTVDAWIRDYGPTFLLQKSAICHPPSAIAMVDWTFNGWGNKYPDYPRDTVIPRLLNEQLHIPRFEPGIVLEGGAIDVNGAGAVLTTEQCLLNPNRNPRLSQAEVEQHLKDYLGVTRIIWLGEGIIGDDTDGHVDDIARFVNPTTIVCALEEDPADDNYTALQENYRRLQAAGFNVVPLPMPGVVSDGARRLPASYANFYIGNQVVLVPTFHHPHDAQAIAILAQMFPTRQVIGIPCTSLVHGYGAIHCVTQQQPQP
ncbi:MAG: agmatine deiminase family protein [Abditibacteriales bacterium]|nr:agmatine deiminase family protein [Abditibacteriales bacterium]MDW8364600.1 agmatine deiminase family protein [Abditibacteriales bacterium]